MESSEWQPGWLATSEPKNVWVSPSVPGELWDKSSAIPGPDVLEDVDNVWADTADTADTAESGFEPELATASVEPGPGDSSGAGTEAGTGAVTDSVDYSTNSDAITDTDTNIAATADLDSDNEFGEFEEPELEPQRDSLAAVTPAAATEPKAADYTVQSVLNKNPVEVLQAVYAQKSDTETTETTEDAEDTEETGKPQDTGDKDKDISALPTLLDYGTKSRKYYNAFLRPSRQFFFSRNEVNGSRPAIVRWTNSNTESEFLKILKSLNHSESHKDSSHQPKNGNVETYVAMFGWSTSLETSAVDKHLHETEISLSDKLSTRASNLANKLIEKRLQKEASEKMEAQRVAAQRRKNRVSTASTKAPQTADSESHVVTDLIDKTPKSAATIFSPFVNMFGAKKSSNGSQTKLSSKAAKTIKKGNISSKDYFKKTKHATEDPEPAAATTAAANEDDGFGDFVFQTTEKVDWDADSNGDGSEAESGDEAAKYGTLDDKVEILSVESDDEKPPAGGSNKAQTEKAQPEKTQKGTPESTKEDKSWLSFGLGFTRAGSVKKKNKPDLEVKLDKNVPLNSFVPLTPTSAKRSSSSVRITSSDVVSDESNVKNQNKTVSMLSDAKSKPHTPQTQVFSGKDVPRSSTESASKRLSMLAGPASNLNTNSTTSSVSSLGSASAAHGAQLAINPHEPIKQPVSDKLILSHSLPMNPISQKNPVLPVPTGPSLAIKTAEPDSDSDDDFGEFNEISSPVAEVHQNTADNSRRNSLLFLSKMNEIRSHSQESVSLPPQRTAPLLDFDLLTPKSSAPQNAAPQQTASKSQLDEFDLLFGSVPEAASQPAPVQAAPDSIKTSLKLNTQMPRKASDEMPISPPSLNTRTGSFDDWGNFEDLVPMSTTMEAKPKLQSTLLKPKAKPQALTQEQRVQNIVKLIPDVDFML